MDRAIFAAAIATFTLSSLLYGVAHTLTQCTLMRIVRGAGGAMMVPVGRLIVLRNTPRDRLTQAIAFITLPGLTALVLGPPLGGFITTYASWHWIFFINLPISVLAFVLIMLWVENVHTGEHMSFDWSHFCLPASLPPASFVPWRTGQQGHALAVAHDCLCAQPAQRLARPGRSVPQTSDFVH